jgi:UDP-GlcNAc:undecaprenyl-phosphate/decaprenyl-phosphate GlcNAc-1-phosphate transferase
VVGALVAFAVSGAWCLALPVLGPRLGYLDHPEEGDLKVHTRPAVPLAGPGLLLGMVIGLTLEGTVPALELVGLSVVTILGAVDDRFQLSPGLRIAVEVVAAALLATRWWDAGMTYAIVGALVVLVAVNAVNLYDGIDGLAGGTGIAGLAALVVTGWLLDIPILIPALLGAALLGFLPFNLHPARVFLGDGGAYLLGAVTAMALWDVGVQGGWAGTVASAGFLGMFAVDLVVTVLRRMRAGEPLFQGDRRHLYDLMVANGRSVPSVALRLVAAHIGLVSLVSFAIVTMSEPVAASLVVIVGLAAIGLAGAKATA